jgi:hypothetical protein
MIGEVDAVSSISIATAMMNRAGTRDDQKSSMASVVTNAIAPELFGNYESDPHLRRRDQIISHTRTAPMIEKP